jgi:hypothetical protein
MGAMVIILQLATTGITAIIPTPVRPMATMVRRGITAASSLARDHGSVAASDSAVASMDGPVSGGLASGMDVRALDMDGRASVAATEERARFEANSPAVASTVMQSAADSTAVAVADSTAAAVAASTVVAVVASTVVAVVAPTVAADTGKTSFIDSMKAAAGFYPAAAFLF